jgi:hypothetical protein
MHAPGKIEPFPQRQKSARAAPQERKPAPVKATSPKNAGPPAAVDGLTVEEYAAAKCLPAERLEGWGLSTITYQGRKAVRMPYLSPDGTEMAVRIRLSLGTGSGEEERFKWRKGSKPCLYGLSRLHLARKAGYVVIVEGESDSHTLWDRGIPALGLPGASVWREQWAEYLQDIPTIYVLIEPDSGGNAVRTWLAASAIRDRVCLVELGAWKDPSALHLEAPERFLEHWQAALEAARPWTAVEEAERHAAAEEAYGEAAQLLHDPALFDHVGEAIRAGGYAGDLAPPLLVYLAITSRLLERPGNVALVAQSAAGKNRAIDAALELMPEEAVVIMSASSPRALIYSGESFEHRAVIVGEADSIPDEGAAASAVRSIAEDGEMIYVTVERNEATGHFEAREIRKPGPTGLITTSTRSLREQLGTRVLEMPVRDDEGQTRAVLEAHAAKVSPDRAPALDTSALTAVQRYLHAQGEQEVIIPFAKALAKLVPANAVRIRRDFRQLLTYIQAAALLHQCQRERTAEGKILATLDDYARVRELLAPIFDAVLADGVTPVIRETVEAIKNGEEIAASELAKRLELPKQTASYRSKRAIAGGWLVNSETRRGCPAKLSLGSPLPEVRAALPSLEDIAAYMSTEGGRGDIPSPEQIGQLDTGAEASAGAKSTSPIGGAVSNRPIGQLDGSPKPKDTDSAPALGSEQVSNCPTSPGGDISPLPPSGEHNAADTGPPALPDDSGIVWKEYGE